MNNFKSISKSKLLLIPSLVLTSTFLFGCFGGSEETVDTPKEKVYSDSTAISQKEKIKLDALKVELEEIAYEDIRASDYTIEQILLKDLDKSYFYGGILTMDSDTILQQQLKYFEVHREYMIYLVRNGANKSDLIYNNRKFRSYLSTLEGRQIDGLKHVKRALEKTFYRYNTLELEAIIKGENLEEFIKSERKYEDDFGMWDWFRKPENANFKGDILYYTNVKFDLLEPSDNDLVKKYNELIKDYIKYTSSGIKTKNKQDVVNKLNTIITTVENSRINEDSKWIKDIVLNYLKYELEITNLTYSNDSMKLADAEFFIDISRQEQLVAISSFDYELNLQEEKRKKAKKEASKSDKKE